MATCTRTHTHHLFFFTCCSRTSAVPCHHAEEGGRGGGGTLPNPSGCQEASGVRSGRELPSHRKVLQVASRRAQPM
eukprot:3819207-Prorocentrum_lima.AAC.1